MACGRAKRPLACEASHAHGARVRRVQKPHITQTKNRHRTQTKNRHITQTKNRHGTHTKNKRITQTKIRHITHAINEQRTAIMFALKLEPVYEQGTSHNVRTPWGALDINIYIYIFIYTWGEDTT